MASHPEAGFHIQVDGASTRTQRRPKRTWVEAGRKVFRRFSITEDIVLKRTGWRNKIHVADNK